MINASLAEFRLLAVYRFRPIPYRCCGQRPELLASRRVLCIKYRLRRVCVHSGVGVRILQLSAY